MSFDPNNAADVRAAELYFRRSETESLIEHELLLRDDGSFRTVLHWDGTTIGWVEPDLQDASFTTVFLMGRCLTFSRFDVQDFMRELEIAFRVNG